MSTDNNYMIYISIIIGIIILYLFIHKRNENFMSMPWTSVDQFIHHLPKQRFPDVVREFGPPTFIRNKPNGIARWHKPQFFSSIMLIDECIKQSKPFPHHSFLYSSIKVHIPLEHIPLIMKLSQSIFYDQLKNELFVRCNCMPGNVVASILSIQISNDPTNAQIYYDSYPTLLISAKKSPIFYKKLKKQLKQLIIDNQKQFKHKFPKNNCRM